MERYVLITGASKGIGKATALSLARQGFQVFAGVRNMADGEALKGEAQGKITPVCIDVTDEAQVRQAVEIIMPIVGQAGLYGLVNNAGMAVAAPLEFVPIDNFRQQIEVNLIGQLVVTQAFLPLIRQARGRIINISSVGGRIAGGMIGAYHASKFALEALTDSLRQELKPWGIEVVAIEPGTIATPIWDTSLAAYDKLAARMNPAANDYYKDAIARTRKIVSTANARGIAPEKVAEAINKALTAARPRTRYIVGTDAQIGIRILSRLPDRLRDRLMATLG
jgi:NAD(P)-dependent dehydrogenase (short-subunit alcohol dehydrogenase family)